MSRYFQQLAYHAGLAVTASAEATRPASPVSMLQSQTNLIEENIEREAMPEPPGALKPSPPMTEFSSATPGKIESVSPARSRKESPATLPDEAENVSPAAVPATSVSVARPSWVEPVAVSRRGNSLSSSTLLQQVVAWIAEAEHPLAAPPSSAYPPVSSSQKKNAPPQSDALGAPLTSDVPPLAGVVEILPAFNAQTTSSASDKENPPHFESLVRPQPTDCPASSSATLCASPTAVSGGDAPDEFHVSIGSIHLTVEPPHSHPSPALPALASRRSTVSTRARRHYLRSLP